MRFTKPAWVSHRDSSLRDQSKPLSIFSCHVHPDCSRIATGGLDAKVRIWSTKPILNAASEESGRPPKSLCTLTMHTGPVLTVRWAHSGRWLASGSDDEIVMIWDLDPTAKGKVWGSDEVNVEGWKPLKRLPGHESDVTDLAWSPGDRYLASVGLDSKVIIWCGHTLERLRKLDQHQGFVKGVCWDPVGEFLATGSDDRTVKIWRTEDWELEAEIKKPFEDSPGTFFRRLSWSPDGAHITASNATNNKGYVFIAAVISRGSWTSEISLVGHENTVEVAAYNPHIFVRDPDNPVVSSNICSVVALGADDRSVSVWQTKTARPIVVAKEVFERQIMDLSWSLDGLTLYAVSSDGTMAVLSFDADELVGLAPLSAQPIYLKKFGFTPPPLPEGYSHTSMTNQPDIRMTPPPSPGREAPQQSQAQAQQDLGQGFGGANGASGGEHINKLVAKRNTKKKRVQLSTIPSAGMGNMPSSSSNSVPVRPTTNGRSFHEIAGIVSSSRPPTAPIQIPSASLHPSPATTTTQDDYSWQQTGQDVEMDLGSHPDNSEVQIDSIGDTSKPSNKGKRKAGTVEFLLDESRPTLKPRTLGGDRVRDGNVPVREIINIGGVAGSPVVVTGGGDANLGLVGKLPPPLLMTYLKVNIEGSDDVFEAQNTEDPNGTNEISFLSGKSTQWLDYVPTPVLALTATTSFCAVSLQDGSLHVYSPTGRRLMPTISLGVPCHTITGTKNMLLLLTTGGMAYAWDVKKGQAVFPPTSISPILGTSPNVTVVSASIRPNGAAVIHLSNGVAHSYDASLSCWIKLSEGWWASGSDAWQGRQRSSANPQTSSTRGIVSSIESTIAERLSSLSLETEAGKTRPEWWNSAMTLGHLETRLHAAKALDSPIEFKQFLVLYAKKIADEGFRGKAEELIKELFGPIYWRPGREDSWSSTVLGLAKRDLLKDVLAVFARSKTLTKLALDWQEVLKKASNGE